MKRRKRHFVGPEQRGKIDAAIAGMKREFAKDAAKLQNEHQTDALEVLLPKWGEIKLPDLEAGLERTGKELEIDMPGLDLPKFDLPEIDLPGLDLPDLDFP